jgi:hypothetical protein
MSGKKKIQFGDLTIVELKKYKGFENSTEEEAEKQIEVIETLARILYYLYVEEEKENRKNENRT